MRSISPSKTGMREHRPCRATLALPGMRRRGLTERTVQAEVAITPDTLLQSTTAMQTFLVRETLLRKCQALHEETMQEPVPSQEMKAGRSVPEDMSIYLPLEALARDGHIHHLPESYPPPYGMMQDVDGLQEQGEHGRRHTYLRIGTHP